jgi:hypothetical protein
MLIKEKSFFGGILDFSKPSLGRINPVMINRKGQEEMVGFALIIVIVMIIGLVFLGFSLRGSNEGVEVRSGDVGDFLESLSQTHTDCAVRASNDFAEIGDLVRECYNRPTGNCQRSGESICEALNRTLSDAVVGGLDVGAGAYYEGFEFDVDFEPRSNSGDSPENILELRSGNCSFNKIGNEHLISNARAEGSLVLTLNLCLGS